MKDYSEYTATMQARLSRLSDALSSKKWARSAVICSMLISDLAQVMQIILANNK